MTIASKVFSAALAKALESQPPGSILAIGPESSQAFADFLKAHPETRIDSLVDWGAIDSLESLGVHDLALVANTLEHMDKRPAGNLIAKLRDLYSKRLYILLSIGPDWEHQQSHWEQTDMIAYGFSLAASFECDGKPVHLYRYDLYNYKLTPEWLNAGHWANPEMWDKARW